MKRIPFGIILFVLALSTVSFAQAAFTPSETTTYDCANTTDVAASKLCEQLRNPGNISIRYQCDQKNGATLYATQNETGGQTQTFHVYEPNSKRCTDQKADPIFSGTCKYRYAPAGVKRDAAKTYNLSYEIYSIGIDKKDIKLIPKDDPNDCYERPSSLSKPELILPVRTFIAKGIPEKSLRTPDLSERYPSCIVPSLLKKEDTDKLDKKIQKELPNAEEIKVNEKTLEDLQKKTTTIITVDCNIIFNSYGALENFEKKNTEDTLKQSLNEANAYLGDDNNECIVRGYFGRKSVSPVPECQAAEKKRAEAQSKLDELSNGSRLFESKNKSSARYLCTSLDKNEKGSEFIKHESCNLVKEACKDFPEAQKFKCNQGAFSTNTKPKPDETRDGADKKPKDCSAEKQGSTLVDNKCLCVTTDGKPLIDREDKCVAATQENLKDEVGKSCDGVPEDAPRGQENIVRKGKWTKIDNGDVKCLVPRCSEVRCSGGTVSPHPSKDDCPNGQKRNAIGVCAADPGFRTTEEKEKQAYCQSLGVRYDPTTKQCAAPTGYNGTTTGGNGQDCPAGQERYGGQCMPKQPNAQQPTGQQARPGTGAQQPQNQNGSQQNPFAQNPYAQQSPFLNALTQQMTCNAFELVDMAMGQTIALNSPFRVRWDISSPIGQKATNVKVTVSPSEAVRYNQSESMAEILPKKKGPHSITLSVTNVLPGNCSAIRVDVQDPSNSSSSSSSSSDSSGYESTNYDSSPIDSNVPPTETIADAQRAAQATKAQVTTQRTTSTQTNTSIATYQEPTKTDYSALCATFGIGCPSGSNTTSTSLNDPIRPQDSVEGGTTDVLVVPAKDKTITENDTQGNSNTRVTKGYFEKTESEETDTGGEYTSAGTADTSGSSSSSGLASFFDTAKDAQNAQGTVSDTPVDPAQIEQQQQPGILSRFWSWIKSWFIWG